MNFTSLIAARPVFVFISLTFIVLLLPCLLTPWWYKTVKHIEVDLDSNSNKLRAALQSEIEIADRFLQPLSSSATNLARVINSSLDSNKVFFSDIQTTVAPSLFQALTTVPLTSQISYIGFEGLFFSYYVVFNQTLAVYCNSSSAPESSVNVQRRKSTWYTQLVDGETGKLYGQAIETSPMSIDYSRLQEALNRTGGFAFIGSGWNKGRESLFVNSARINERGAVSLGFPVKAITNIFTSMDLYGGSLSIATADGQVLVEGLPNTHMIVTNTSIVSKSRKINDGDDQKTSDIRDYPCMAGKSTYYILDVGEIDYKVYCSPIELAGVKSVCALAVPRQGLLRHVHKTSEFALILLIIMIVSIVISVFSFVYLMVRSAKREVHMCASLINQMEATQQAERKSMTKSLAFASASHDIRAALAGMTGLIEICQAGVPAGCEMETNLRQMDGCTKDLMSLLNSILDQSKIDAGKMQLEEEEFNIGGLLEDVVDLYHPVAMKKGVEVVLDPSDCSVNKYSQVKGDRGKLKQVLCNLLSNAVKFTSEGHIAVRAWVQKPSLENSVIDSNRNGFLQHISCLLFKNKTARNDLEAVNSVRLKSNCMEFVFEVDDTGKGIPKEKQQSVFENYVQVKEGEGGTGLGLGIVQSLVRLMGGEIKIMDKGIGEKGACFRLNVFLTVDEACSSADNTSAELEMGVESSSSGPIQPRGLTVQAPSPGLTIRTHSPRLTSILSPKPEGSQVVLLIGNEERRRIALKYMEHLGINVSVAKGWENLRSVLKKLKYKLSHSPHSSRGKSDWGSRSDNSGVCSKDIPLSAMEGTDHPIPSQKRRGAPGFVLLVIDATAGPFSEILRAVTEFRRDFQCLCKVVWLDKPTSRSIVFNDPEELEMMDSRDIILTKPFHGSRLNEVIRLLPEYGGTSSPGDSTKPGTGSTLEVEKGYSDNPGSSHSRTRAKRIHHPRRRHRIQQSETQEEYGSGSGNYSSMDISSTAPVQTHGGLKTGSATQVYKTNENEIEEVHGEERDKKPLTGKRFLVAEDNAVLRRLATLSVTQLGGTVEVCENGEEALKLVLNGLQDQIENGGAQIMPYDYILMDCEMPEMNGYEATKHIREREKYYGIHIPIIALTAHVSGEGAKNTILAGMDVHLGKPLRKEKLMEAIRYIDSK